MMATKEKKCVLLEEGLIVVYIYRDQEVLKVLEEMQGRMD